MSRFIRSHKTPLHSTSGPMRWKPSIDLFLHRHDKIGQTAMRYLHKGPVLLRERLPDDDDILKISDPTVSVVAKLESATHMNGEHLTARKQMEGLRRMLDLRGGIQTFLKTDLLVGMVR